MLHTVHSPYMESWFSFPCILDGVLKCWELDSGRLVVTLREHKGWVTDLLYW